MTENQFLFNGVGQGLFYSGSIYNNAFNFVYDCGTMSSDKSHIKKAISALPKELNFVAISHLHDDHVNGLPELFERTRVNKIYLPYFDVKTYKDVFVASLVSCNILPNTTTFWLLLKLYDVKIDIDMQVESLSQICLERIEQAERICLQEDITPHDIHEKWRFCFYNRKIDDKLYKELKDTLQVLLNGKTIEQYIKERNGNFQALRKAFNKIYNDANMSSLLLMHWNLLTPTKKTLLTGDVKFDQFLEESIHEEIKEGDEIVLQVPHHGATTEWQSVPQYIDNQASDIVLSFGLTNGYHHPSIKTLMNYYKGAVLCEKIKFVYEDKPYQYSI